MVESEEKLKSPLMKMKEESEKDGLKLNTQKTKIMAFQSQRKAMPKNAQTTTQYSDRLYFLGVPKSLQMVAAAMKLKDTCSLEEKL